MIPMIPMIDMVPTILPQFNEFGVAMRNVQLPEYYNISTLNLIWQKIPSRTTKIERTNTIVQPVSQQT